MGACGACFGKAIGREVIDKTLRAETRRGDRIVLLVETKTINTVTSPQITNHHLGVDDGCAPRAACLCAFLPAYLRFCLPACRHHNAASLHIWSRHNLSRVSVLP